MKFITTTAAADEMAVINSHCFITAKIILSLFVCSRACVSLDESVCLYIGNAQFSVLTATAVAPVSLSNAHTMTTDNLIDAE